MSDRKDVIKYLICPKILAESDIGTIKDYCIYVCHQVAYAKFVCKFKNPFVSSKELRKVLNKRNYGKVLEFLTVNHYITKTRNYKVGERCNSYDLCNIKQEFTAYPVTRKSPIFNKIEKLQKESQIQKQLMTARYNWIIESLKKVTISKENEFGSLANTLAETLLAPEVCNVSISEAGRLYYSVAYLPKIVRKEILIDGEETKETDIACCQPYLCLSLYPAESSEKKVFAEFLKNNDFYSDIFGEEGVSRADTKEKVYSSLLFGSAASMNSKFVLPFRKMFPELWTIIYGAKVGNPNKKSDAGNGNSYFANLLQGIESKIIFNTVEHLRKSNIPCLTIHDSIRAKQSDAETVFNFLHNECTKALGVEPKLTIEN